MQRCCFALSKHSFLKLYRPEIISTLNCSGSRVVQSGSCHQIGPWSDPALLQEVRRHLKHPVVSAGSEVGARHTKVKNATRKNATRIGGRGISIAHKPVLRNWGALADRAHESPSLLCGELVPPSQLTFYT
jgi:hypothetical protein